MNRLFHFSTGTLMTFAFNCSLPSSDAEYFLIKQLVSIAGGILSSILIAWCKQHWNNRNPPPPSG